MDGYSEVANKSDILINIFSWPNRIPNKALF